MLECSEKSIGTRIRESFSAGADTALVVGWLKKNGYERVAALSEVSPNGEEYFQYFRWAADQYGVRIVALETITQTPDDLEASVWRLREVRPDALAYMGYGYPTILLGPIFEKLDWRPPRIMTTAMQFGYARPEWMAALEGWTGIDQYCEDNPRVEPFLDRYPAQLSGGQRQRVAVARALVMDAPVLLMDEPLSNLDALLRLQARADLKRLHREVKRTTVYVTHDQVEAMSMGDRIAVMREGAIEQCEPPMQLYTNPASQFVGGFIGSPPMNFLRGRASGGTFQGEGFSVPLDAGGGPAGRDAARVEDGRELLLGIRAEQIRFGEQGIPARVQVVEPLPVPLRENGPAVVVVLDYEAQVGDLDLAAWLAKWQGTYPKLCGWVEEHIEQTLSFYRLPRQHHKHLKSTNLLERLNEAILAMERDGRMHEIVTKWFGDIPYEPDRD